MPRLTSVAPGWTKSLQPHAHAVCTPDCFRQALFTMHQWQPAVISMRQRQAPTLRQRLFSERQVGLFQLWRELQM